MAALPSPSSAFGNLESIGDRSDPGGAEEVRELVETGRLKHPDVVRANNKRRETVYRQRVAEDKAKREAELRAKAAEALRVNDLTGEMVDRVVAAMKWAAGED